MFYDYYCPDCGHEQEEQHGMTEDPIIKCPHCYGFMRRIVTGGSATHLKGGGWAGKPAQDASQAKHSSIKIKQEQVTE